MNTQTKNNSMFLDYQEKVQSVQGKLASNVKVYWVGVIDLESYQKGETFYYLEIKFFNGIELVTDSYKKITGETVPIKYCNYDEKLQYSIVNQKARGHKYYFLLLEEIVSPDRLYNEVRILTLPGVTEPSCFGWISDSLFTQTPEIFNDFGQKEIEGRHPVVLGRAHSCVQDLKNAKGF